MISLSIISDFCSWWIFWWIAPFLLGLMLGWLSWGKYKRRVVELEDEVRKHNLQIHNLNSALKQSQKKAELSNIKLSDKDKELALMKEQVTITKKRNLALAQGFSPAASATPKIVPSAKSTKGDYSKLQKTNLQIIEGIGPKLETVLKENGVNSWADLSKRSHGELRAILDKYGSRYAIVDPTSWPSQASLAKKEKWKKLMELQAKDGGDSKLKKILLKLKIL